MHLFKADNQTQFNEWFKFLEKVISNSYNNNNRKNSAQKPKEDSSFFVYTNNKESIAQCNDLVNNSLNNSMSSLSSTSTFDSIKISSFNSPTGYNNNITAESSSKYNNNIFDVYNLKQRTRQKPNEQENEKDSHLFWYQEEKEEDDPQLECTACLLLMKCLQFNLNLNMPIISNPINILNSNSTNDLNLHSKAPKESISHLNQINSELFFIHLNLFDARLNQRVSETFTWLPNYKHYFKTNANTNKIKSKFSHNNNNISSEILFTLNGKDTLSLDDELGEMNNFLKENILTDISQVIYSNYRCKF
jgi:hypothetical protein